MGTAATLQLGYWRTTDDSFQPHPGSPTGAVIDLNDGATFSILDGSEGLGNGLDWESIAPTVYDAGNPRTTGRSVTRRAYDKQRTLKVKLLWGPTSSYSAWSSAVHNLLACMEAITPTQPAALKFQPSGSSTPLYFDVLEAHASSLPYLETLWMQNVDEIELQFYCRPFLRAARVTLQNLATNPGYEAPSGPAVPVFSDTFATTNAYAVQAGGALAQDKSYYPDAVMADAPIRYYRLDEAAGTTAYDGSANVQNGTLHGGITLGAGGGLTGDTDTAYTFNGSTGYVSVPTSGIPTGAAACSIECWFHIGASYPAGTVVLMGHGSWFVAHQLLYLQLDSTGHLSAANGSITSTSSAALSKNAWHHAAAVWDGSKLFCYADGAATDAGTADASMNVTMGAATIGASADHSGAFYGDSLDECAWYATGLSAARVLAHYNAGHNSPSSAGNTAVLAAGNRVSFGSPAWGALNLWSLRLRYFNGATATFYLHYADANNYLAVTTGNGSFALVQAVGGVAHTLASAATLLPQNGLHYWLQVTQFPAPASDLPYVQAALYWDVNGAKGNQLASGSIAACTFDTVTALVGAPQIAVSGGSLGLGGNYANVHTVSLFGPGGWTFSGTGGTGPASGAWDGARLEMGMSGTATTGTQTTSTGPVTSFGAARADAAPAGTLSAQWNLFAGGASGDGTSAIPVVAAGDVLYAQCWLKSSGLGNGATVALKYTEYNAAGTSLRSGTLQTLTISGGVQLAWGAAGRPNLSGHWTTGANCAYADIQMVAADTVAANSANATVWLDNVQCWDATASGMTSMPYCELRFPQSPAQLMVSGLLGDVPAPAAVALAGYGTVGNGGATTVAYFFLGRRAQASAGACLVSPAPPGAGGSSTLSATAYGGFFSSNAIVNTGGTAPSFGFSQFGADLVASDMQGTYHPVMRLQSVGAGSPTTVAVALGLYQSSGVDPYVGNVTGNDYEQSATLTPLAANSTWTRTDFGQFQVPFVSLPGQTDLTKITEAWILAATNNQAATIAFDYVAALPTDGEYLAAAYTQYAGIAYGTVDLAVFWDGVARTLAYALLQPMPRATYATAGAAVVTAASSGLANLGDATPQVDPTLLVANGGATSAVNQYVAQATDAAATLWPVHATVTYSPRYVYPL